jgi:uncharacterized protein YjbI with pentapeptide repeats
VTDFTSQDLTGSRFEAVHLTGARFRDVDLTNARFHLVDLTGVTIRGAALVNMDLSAPARCWRRRRCRRARAAGTTTRR